MKIADLMLAVNRAFGKSDYIPCIAWGRTARYAAGLSVGDRLWKRPCTSKRSPTLSPAA